ncbi:VanZ family protein [Streptomyces sulfonofaciens]|uniref:VanZ family protein n=1 Tax=Streptomyces sulfonofaciens TaxID=68272 RepID=A0A919G4Z6_9ACTN|nr:VanZ family protein [Streptomyces sulfonofaciens]
MHLVLVAWITLRPLDVPWMSPANLHPLAGIRADLALGAGEATLRIGAGLLLLAPLGVLLPLAGGRLAVSPLGSLVRTVTAAALLSLGIELLQTGVPGQVVDVDALLLNPLGVALAHLAVVPAVRARLRRKAGALSRPCDDRLPGAAPGATRDALPEDGSQGPAPTIPRVRIAP